MERPYSPGVHLIADFTEVNADRLKDMAGFRQLVHTLVEQLGLTSVGEVFHGFDSGGFTAAICLTESHLSIHTWPEYGRLTFDVFLSNYLQRNETKVKRIYEEVKTFYLPGHIKLTEVER